VCLTSFAAIFDYRFQLTPHNQFVKTCASKQKGKLR
jgi:hypothetical protein